MRFYKYGRDYLTEVKFAHLEKVFKIYYWDFWISLIIESEGFKGDWDKLIETLKRKSKQSTFLMYNFESLYGQIQFFRQHLSSNSLTSSDIIEKIQETKGTVFLEQQLEKAQKKVLLMDIEEEDKTRVMNLRSEKRETAIKGDGIYYHGEDEMVDASPLDYIMDFWDQIEYSYFVGESKKIWVTDRLAEKAQMLVKDANIFELFAIYRAFLTVVIEEIENVPNSRDEIGEMVEEIFYKYITLDRSQLRIDILDFWGDLLNLMIWEDYGFFDAHYKDVFKGLTKEEIEIITFILQLEKEELEKAMLDYPAEKANKIQLFFEREKNGGCAKIVKLYKG